MCVLRRMQRPQYQERDGEEDRNPGGKTLATDIWKVEVNVKEDEVLDRITWKGYIHRHFGHPR